VVTEGAAGMTVDTTEAPVRFVHRNARGRFTRDRDGFGQFIRKGDTRPRVPAIKAKRRLLTRAHIDKRSKVVQQFDAIAAGIAADLGGEGQLSTVMRHLVEGFAGVACHVNDINARLLVGEEIDIVEHSQAISTMVRIASKIGIRRVPKIVTHDLRDYIEEREAAE
jgi:hypothetical protein